MDQTPKHIKRALRELAGRAYEVELGRDLTSLHEEFSRWQRGEITAFDVTEAIHRFHQGPARELWVRYNDDRPNLAVAFAIAAGILDRTQVTPEVLEHVASALSYYEGQRSRG